MKATIPWLGALLLAALAAPLAHGQQCFGRGVPQAPDACGPGFYAQYPQGGWYGPNYYLQPPYPPWNGAVFGPRTGGGASGAPGYGGPGNGGPGNGGPGNGGPGFQGTMSFPTHPFARSPRDFFMMD